MILKPKVAIITPGSFPIPSPRSSSVETVVNMHTTALKNAVDFTIYGKLSKELPSFEKQGNISYVRYRYRKWTSYLSKILNNLSNLNADIIQIENRPKYVAYVRQRFPKAKIWLSMHSTMFMSKSYIHKEKLINCLEQTDKIIVNSQFLKEYLIEKTGCANAKISVNHLGVDIHQFQSKWGSNYPSKGLIIKKQLNLENKNILLFVGRLRKIKGAHKILQALPAIINAHPDTVLIIAGSAYYGSDRITSYVETLYELAKASSDHIRFISFIPHEEIHTWFELADIVLVPSIGKEAFGLVNIEAMACGVPVIASDIGGIPEIIEHGKTGYLINVKNIEAELTQYVSSLLTNPRKLKELGKNCVNKAHDYFTWEESAKRLFGLYMEEVK